MLFHFASYYFFFDLVLSLFCIIIDMSLINISCYSMAYHIIFYPFKINVQVFEKMTRKS